MAIIREASPSDWPRLEPLVRAVVADGRTIAWPEDLSSTRLSSCGCRASLRELSSPSILTGGFWAAL